MNVRQFLPTDWKQLVRITVALIVIRLVVNFVGPKLPQSVSTYLPNLG